MPKQYPKDVRDQAVRLVLDHRVDYDSDWAAIRVIAERLNIGAETLRRWVLRADVDAGARPGVTSTDLVRMKELERQVRELKRTNEILKAASVFFARELDPERRYS